MPENYLTLRDDGKQELKSFPICLAGLQTSQFLMVAGDLLIIPHGLTGINPLTSFTIIQGWIVCTTADRGYQPGDPPVLLQEDERFTVYFDSANLYAQFGNNAPRIVNANNGNTQAIRYNRWEFFFRFLYDV